MLWAALNLLTLRVECVGVGMDFVTVVVTGSRCAVVLIVGSVICTGRMGSPV